MKEYPILFNGSMVRALLDGRKTQTRRIGKIQCPEWTELGCSSVGHATKGTVLQATYRAFPNAGTARWAICECPYGLPGDELWVRESIIWNPENDNFYYSADKKGCGVEAYSRLKKKSLPSIHMFRWLSRLTLEITSIRVERLQDITEADAIAEGLKYISKDGSKYKWGIPDRDGLPGTDDDGWPWQEWCSDPREAYRKLWDSIHGKTHPWSSNPWVWVVEFSKVVMP